MPVLRAATQEKQMEGTISPEAFALAERFKSGALVVPVTEAGLATPGRLRVPSGHEEKLDALRGWAESRLRQSGHIGRTGDLVDGLLSQKFVDDVWYRGQADGTMIVLVKADVYRQVPESEILEQVHRAEIESAAQRGEAIPEDLLRYYRGKARAAPAPASL